MPTEQVDDFCADITGQGQCPGKDVHCHVERRHCVDWDYACSQGARSGQHGGDCCHCKSIIT